MTDDTEIGGGHGGFPTTALSAIVGAASDDSDRRRGSFATLIAAYWKAVYKHARLKWRKSNEDAKDIAQGFFARAMEKGFFDAYDPGKARFRTFLRLCLDRYIAGEAKGGPRAETGRGCHPPLARFRRGRRRAYFEIMLPGAVLGLVVGFATQRFGRARSLPARDRAR